MIHFSAAALAVVFAVALPGKMSPAGFAEFRRSVGRLWPGREAPAPFVRHALSVVVVAGEGLVAVVLATSLLLAGAAAWPLRVAGFVTALGLLAAFTVGHAVALGRGRAVRCACFGRASTTVGPLGLVRNALLIALAVTGLTAVLLGRDTVSIWDVLPAVLAGTVCGLLLVNLEDLVGLFGASGVTSRQGG